MDLNYLHRANQSIAHGALTNSKRVSSFIEGISPTHAKKGQGAFIWDQDNKKYIDFICALGSNLFGYSNPYIVGATKKNLEQGVTLSLSSTIEVEAAEKLKEVLPFVDKVRFLKTGTEAAMASIRIARAQTGRMKVLQQGYDGWSDELISSTLCSPGVNKSTEIEQLTSLDQINNEIAAVIMEPIITDYSPERIRFLEEVRKKTQETGTILIFDEIITGFRFPSFCFSRHTNIIPDLLLLGKCIAGGLPLSCICLNKKGLDSEDWFISSTFAGETISLTVFIDVINLLTNKYKIQDLWDRGSDMLNRFNLISPDVIRLEGYGTRAVFKADDLTFGLFMQECHRAGILIGPSFFLNFANIEYKDQALSTFQDIILRIKNKQVKLEGKLPKKPLSMKVRG